MQRRPPPPRAAAAARPWHAHRLSTPRAVAVLVGGCVLLAGAGLAVRSAASAQSADELASRVLLSRGELSPSLLYARHPERLPSRWRGRSATLSARGLGGQPIEVPRGDGAGLLLIVSCDPSDRSFEYAISDAERVVAHGFGRCGHLDPVPLRVPEETGLRMVVATRGLVPFSLALYRATGSTAR